MNRIVNQVRDSTPEKGFVEIIDDKIQNNYTPDYGADKPQFLFKSARDLTENLCGTQYLIKPFFQRDVVGVMFGESGAKKSFKAIDIGLHVASGLDYHGRNTNKGSVIYFCGEGLSGVGKRVVAWKIHHNLKDDDIEFYTSELPGEFKCDVYINSIIRSIKLLNVNPVLIIIDTLATNLGAGDENSNNDISHFIKNLNKIRKVFNCNILVVHHTGHSQTDRERGAYSLRGDADYRILIQRTDNGCSMSCKKVKDGIEWDAVAFEQKYVEIPGLFDSEGEHEGSLVLVSCEYVEPIKKELKGQGKNQKIVLRLIHELANQQLLNIHR